MRMRKNTLGWRFTLLYPIIGRFVKPVLLLAACLGLFACNLTQPAPTLIPTPDLPQVVILDPPNNRQVIEGVDFPIDILARDEAAGVARLELYVDGELINSATPFYNITEPLFRVEMNWRARGVGLHVIEAIAYRQDGTPSDPALITIEVLPRRDGG